MRDSPLNGPTETTQPKPSSLAWAAAWTGIAIVTFLALRRMRTFPYHLSWSAAWSGISSLVSETGWAALKVWTFWTWGAGVLAALALRIEPELEQTDAFLLGAGGLWVLAYMLGNLLGPVGWFNAATVWGLLLLGTAWLWRNPPNIERRTASSGRMLAALAVGMLAVSYLPLQLGSPLPPFMDVLSYPASAQRILTFGIYDPFNNDPYGCWGPYAQTPALELFYAMLAMGSHTSRAALAETAAMLPMAALIIFATWRLGLMMFGDTAGGMAALFLFFTCLFRRAQGMRGTAVDFAMVALALAFFMNRRGRVLFVAGAIMLGTAVASHAIDGAFAMIVAGVGALIRFSESGPRRFAADVVALAGATLIAIPELLIGLGIPIPYPVIPALMMLGVAMVLGGARLIRKPTASERDLPPAILSRALIAVLILAVLYRHATNAYSLYQQIADNLPMLTLFCFGGLVAALAMPWRGVEARYAALAAAALMLGIAGEYIDPLLRALSHNPATGMMASDIGIKLWDYWCPYFLVLPAGFLFALAYDRWSRPATLFALLTLLIYPWRQIANPVDYDSVEHSITEQWAFNLHTAALGYWAGHADRRWTFTPREWSLIDALESEIGSGRITHATHVLHLCQSISSWTMVHFSVLTGINDDPIEYEHDPNNLWEGGSRVRGMNEVTAAIAAHPPYILEQVGAPRGVGDPPPGYQKIYDSGPVRLYRREDLARITSPHALSVLYSLLPGIAAAAAALILAIGKARKRRSGSANPFSGAGENAGRNNNSLRDCDDSSNT